MKLRPTIQAIAVVLSTLLTQNCELSEEEIRVQNAAIEHGNQTVISDNFRVYVRKHRAFLKQYPGTIPRDVPTISRYTKVPGCYLLCYTRDRENSTGFSVGHGIFVAGQFRVAGKYVDRICRPTADGFTDVSAKAKYKTRCANHFVTACQNGCWAGGDTGGWFGIR